jgi:hypothetical protein
LAPSDIPRNIVAKLIKDVNDALNDPERSYGRYLHKRPAGG